MTNLFDVINHFKIVGNPLSIEPYGSGHINVTYLVTTDKQRYILQKINNNLFTEVDKLMNNIYLVTKHLNDKVTNKVIKYCLDKSIKYIKLVNLVLGDLCDRSNCKVIGISDINLSKAIMNEFQMEN